MRIRGSRHDPDHRTEYGALALLRVVYCVLVASASQIGLQRPTAPGAGRSATLVASMYAEKLQGGLCTFQTPLPRSVLSASSELSARFTIRLPPLEYRLERTPSTREPRCSVPSRHCRREIDYPHHHGSHRSMTGGSAIYAGLGDCDLDLASQDNGHEDVRS